MNDLPQKIFVYILDLACENNAKWALSMRGVGCQFDSAEQSIKYAPISRLVEYPYSSSCDF